MTGIARRTPHRGRTLVSATPNRPIHVLLVEDNDDDIEIAKHVLAKSGVAARLHIVRDGREALDFLYHRRRWRDRRGGGSVVPDLALLDLRLPKIDGLAVLQQMRSDRRLRSIPVVVLTGEANDRLLRACMEFGANMYLVKPMAMEDVMNILAGVQRYWVAIDRQAA